MLPDAPSDYKREQECTDFIAKIPVEWDETKSVSYTHLRAHETVLDLVCRLLLEKKTTNNNYEQLI